MLAGELLGVPIENTIPDSDGILKKISFRPRDRVLTVSGTTRSLVVWVGVFAGSNGFPEQHGHGN